MDSGEVEEVVSVGGIAVVNQEKNVDGWLISSLLLVGRVAVKSSSTVSVVSDDTLVVHTVLGDNVEEVSSKIVTSNPFSVTALDVDESISSDMLGSDNGLGPSGIAVVSPDRVDVSEIIVVVSRDDAVVTKSGCDVVI